ncbi:hypothetical protein ATO11_16055 [Pseudaestuariivita atlantica]|uniref:Uncharacterized protein n=2 Tax=Pseudaestuariivita atlantica TaxID=1317121 RepID=A0A0L1JLB5_9RHOB|nr:hypothetical protein ATO11_16055 [Pseudaestuariivita atlantica]
MTLTMAQGGSELIANAIHAYKKAGPANALPEGLERFEDLPAHFKAIRETLDSDRPLTDLEEALIIEIQRLHATISRLESEARAAKEKGLGRQFCETWVNGMASTLSDKWFLGGLGLFTAHFTGLDVSDLTFQNLRGYISEIMSAAPNDATATPKMTTDI